MMSVVARCVYVLFLSASPLFAGGTLSSHDIDRLKAIKHMTVEVDKKSLPQTIAQLEAMPYPRVQVEIQEAMAHTYAELIKEQSVSGLRKREWLYSMITLNMAYLQFVGPKEVRRDEEALNTMIREKLKQHLPADIFKHPGFRMDVE